MDDDGSIFIGQGGGGPQRLVLKRANRHGLIAGATGTGKTVTLQGLVEGFSAAGVPVFLADELTLAFGNVSKASVGTIQRSLLQLRSQGGDSFFGEPALEIGDLVARDERGRGIVNILAADRLMASPKLYSTFLLWLLSELFEQLPEVGDPDRPV